MSIDLLPRFIVLKSQRNEKFLVHQREDQDKLQFFGTDVASLHIKFEVEPSSTERGLVHLKCCYNNKYWVCKPNQFYISASANEKEEDQSKLSCTLFKPEFFTPKRMGLFHVHSKVNVYFQDVRPHYLYMGRLSKDGDYLDFFDWDSLTILPRYIAIKGNNDLYLNVSPDLRFLDDPFADIPDGISIELRFSNNDKGHERVGMEVFLTLDGNARFKSIIMNKYWRLSRSWIWPDTIDYNEHKSDTLFKVIKIGNNKIALQNLGNDKFLERKSNHSKNDCLYAESSTISADAEFVVEELVKKRVIFNVQFHEKEARIYEKQILHKTKATDFNNTDVSQQGTLEFEYTKEESQTWTTSSSLQQTVETEITAGVPEVVGGKLSISVEVTKSLEHGKTLSEKKVTKYTKTVTVPQRSKIVADFLVTQALCDVPYSYREREVLSNGNVVFTNKDDGLYSCVHTEVKFNANQEKEMKK